MFARSCHSILFWFMFGLWLDYYIFLLNLVLMTISILCAWAQSHKLIIWCFPWKLFGNRQNLGLHLSSSRPSHYHHHVLLSAWHSFLKFCIHLTQNIMEHVASKMCTFVHLIHRIFSLVFEIINMLAGKWFLPSNSPLNLFPVSFLLLDHINVTYFREVKPPVLQDVVQQRRNLFFPPELSFIFFCKCFHSGVQRAEWVTPPTVAVLACISLSKWVWNRTGLQNKRCDLQQWNYKGWFNHTEFYSILPMQISIFSCLKWEDKREEETKAQTGGNPVFLLLLWHHHLERNMRSGWVWLKIFMF